jgi:ribosomal-protein-alanine N-acetyltransferase
MDIVLRRLRSEDIDQVVEIEQEAFSPIWTSTPFKRELNNRFASYLVACYDPEGSLPGEAGGGDEAANPPLRARFLNLAQSLFRREQSAGAAGTLVAGYVSVWYQGDEAHITEIAVRETMRGRGIGELLLIGSLRAAVEYGARVMTLEARVSNFIAQRLYEKYGFKSVGTRKAYYSDNREDAVIMTTSPIGTAEYQSAFQQLQEAYRSRRGEICIQS